MSSRISSVKNYVRQTSHSAPQQQGWSQWAGQKIKDLAHGAAGVYNGSGSGDSRPSGVERIYLFPGFATRRYRDGAASKDNDSAPFDMYISIAGWAASHPTPGVSTRSQRAFIQLAKRYAALPKLAAVLAAAAPDQAALSDGYISKSTEDLLKDLPPLPPPPTDMDSDEAELAALEAHLKRVELAERRGEHSASSSQSDLISFSTPDSPSLSRSSTPPIPPASMSTPDLHTLHANLEARLLPFWSSVLPSRTVRLSVFATLGDAQRLDARADPAHEPVLVNQVQTGTDGSYTLAFVVPWERLCTHPRALHLAFGDPTAEAALVVRAELLAPPPPPIQQQLRQPGVDLETASRLARAPRPPVAEIAMEVQLSHSPVRVISDIDDTIKHASILSGSRTAFYNVFVKDLQEALIPGMPEWYNDMFKRGVRFHYVSNGPFELLPVVLDFFQLSKLPAGSVKLRSYAGRSLFNGLLAAPAERKRQGVVDLLDAFPFSRFFLIGDSGEQDLELYAQLAAERPKQILGVFIRDVHTHDGLFPPIDDPTGAQAGDLGYFSSVDTGLTAGSSSSSAEMKPVPPTGYRPGLTSTASTALVAAARKAGASARSMRSGSSGSSFDTGAAAASESGKGGSGVSPTAYVPYRPRSRASSNGSIRTLGSLDTEVAPSVSGRSPASASGRSFDAPPLHPSLTRVAGGALTASSAAPSGHTSGGGQTPVRPPLMDSPLAEEPESASRASTPLSMPLPRAPTGLSDLDRRRWELQARVHRARARAPAHIALRVFRDPGECVEAGALLDRLRIGASGSSAHTGQQTR